MKFRHYITLLAITIGFVTLGYAQKGNITIKNGFALGGGVTQFNIITDNFDTKAGSGWVIHASATGDIPHKWYNLSYGMQLSESTFEVSGRTSNTTTENEMIEYKAFMAQLAFMGHVKMFQGHFTIDAGPMLQYNGNLELKDDTQEGYFINNYDNLTAEDLTLISNIQFNGAIGASVGIGPLKLRAQYIYGFTNILNKLNDQDIDTTGNTGNFKGNQSMMAFTALFTF
jgi:hypothetical protein